MSLRQLCLGLVVLALVMTTGCCCRRRCCWAPCVSCCTSCCSSPAVPASFTPIPNAPYPH